MTYSRFLELFPDSDACLDYLKAKFYPDGSQCPSCGKVTKFHRVRGRAAYSCQYCRHQVYPTAGTIFHKSTTSLQLWFWAIYLMSSTRCGMSAKQLEREIGVSYPTAHRMFKQIRSLLADDSGPLSGQVEVDETAIGGRPRHLLGSHSAAGKWIDEHKQTVFGMVERGGRVRAKVVPDRKKPTLQGAIHEHVLPESMIFSDEWPLYVGLGRSYREHHRIQHKAKVYVRHEDDGTSVHTNSIENFWALLKNGLRGVYHSVSAKHLQDYVNEYAFRFNRRDGRDPIFWAILDRVTNGQLAAP